MNLLVTAGNTLVPIDSVRGITNIFTGRTGAAIAVEAHRRGHRVTLLTSHPEAVTDHRDQPGGERWSMWRFRTFDNLRERLEMLLREGGLDVLVHCAAVSDYSCAGVYAPAPHTHFTVGDATWHAGEGSPALTDRSAGKVKSDEPELWLRLVRAPKLIDLVRSEWGFTSGLVVKFKLEVGVGDEQLLETAERSRQQSAADLMVANTLEGAQRWAFLGPLAGRYERVSRRDLPGRLLDALEHLHEERRRG